MGADFWSLSQAELNPLDAHGEEAARRFAHNFKLSGNSGIVGAAVQADILSEARSNVHGRLQVFCELTGVAGDSATFQALFNAGERSWMLNSELDSLGNKWLHLFTLAIMTDDEFNQILELGTDLKDVDDTKVIIDAIVSFAKARSGSK
jgi:hypothetical protein